MALLQHKILLKNLPNKKHAPKPIDLILVGNISKEIIVI